MSTPPLTLNRIRQSERIRPRNVGVADLISKEEMQEVRKKQAEIRKKQNAKKKRLFDDVDAYVAEMIARFGYDFYLKWNREELDDGWVARLMSAERAREATKRLPLEGLIRAVVQGGVPTFQPKRLPKGVNKQVQKIIKEELKMMRGEW